MQLLNRPKHGGRVRTQSEIMATLNAMTSQARISVANENPRTQVAIPSQFELLPLEIRQHIYGYLGFPVARVTWLNYWDPKYCVDFSWAMPGPKGDRQYGMVQLTKISFLRAFAGGPDVLVQGTELPSGKPKRAISRICKKNCNYCAHQRPMGFQTSMMRLNKRIHAELCEMLYSRITVEFDFELSDRKVHFIEDQWHTEGKRYWAGDRHSGYASTCILLGSIS